MIHVGDTMIHLGGYPEFRCEAIISRSGDVQCIRSFNI